MKNKLILAVLVTVAFSHVAFALPGQVQQVVPPPDATSIGLTAGNKLSVLPGDSGALCPGASQTVAGTGAGVGSMWNSTGPNCGPRVNVQNAPGTWRPLDYVLPLDAGGTPAQSVTTSVDGSGWVSGDYIALYPGGTIAHMSGGTSTHPTFTIDQPGNWGYGSATTQTVSGVNIKTTGSGTGLTVTVSTPRPVAFSSKLLSADYSGNAATLTATNASGVLSTKALSFVGGVWDQATGDTYCAKGFGFTATGTWANGGSTFTLNSSNGEILTGDNLVSLGALGLPPGKFFTINPSAGSYGFNGTASAAGTGALVAVTPPSWDVSSRNCHVTTMNDQGGGAHDVSNAAPATAPVYPLGRAWNGVRPTSFTGAFHSPPQPYVTYLSTADGSFAWNLNNFTYYGVLRAVGSRETRGLAGPTSDTAAIITSGAPNFFQGYGSGLAVPGNSSSNNACPVGPDDSYSIIVVSTDSANIYCSDGSHFASRGIGAFSEAVTGFQLGTSVLTDNSHTIATGHDQLAAILYPYKNSAAQQQAVVASLATAFGIPLQHDDIVMFDGDSENMAGSGMNITAPYLAQALVRRPARFINVAVSGSNLGTAHSPALTSLVPLTICSAYTSLGGAALKNFVVPILAGVNNIRASDDLATLKAALQGYVTAVRNCNTDPVTGKNIRILIVTPYLPQDIGASTPMKAVFTPFVQWEEAQATLSQSLGGVGGDGLADIYADPAIGGSGGTSAWATYPNQYAADQYHPTDNGAGYMAAVMAKAIDLVRQY